MLRGDNKGIRGEKKEEQASSSCSSFFLLLLFKKKKKSIEIGGNGTPRWSFPQMSPHVNSFVWSLGWISLRVAEDKKKK